MIGRSERVDRAAMSVAGGFLAVTALAVLDAVTSLTLFGAIGLGVVITALAAPRRWVLVVGAYAVACVAFLGAPERWTLQHGLRLVLVAAAVALAVALSDARQRYQDALRRTTQIADVSQRALLGELPVTDRADLAVRYLSASAGALVGGDVYDVADTRWGLRLFVADMCGHGLDAVNGSSVLLQAFRRAAHAFPSLDEVAAQIDRDFSAALEGHKVAFATGVIVEVAAHEVTVANCGHHDPLLIRRDQHRALAPEQRTTPFGLGPHPRPIRFAVVPGDRVVLYTDGLIEARNAEDQPFDLEACAPAIGRAGTIKVAVDEVVTRVQRHVDGPLRDDVVVLLAQMTAQPPSSAAFLA